MPRSTQPTEVLTIRVPRQVAARLATEARRQRRTKSQVARALLVSGLEGPDPEADPSVEARRQSLLASRRRSEAESLRFVITAADTRGWK